MKEKGLSLRKQWNEAWNYIGKSKNQIYFIILLFFVSSWVGYVISSYLGFLDEFLRELVLQVENLNVFELIFFIMQNNAKTAFFGVLFGVFLGIVPIVTAVGNGIVLGYVASKVVAEVGVLGLWRILPHGIFELAGVFISLGLGMKLAGFLFAKPGKRLKVLKERFYQSMNAFLLVVLPLLILAAIIEGVLIAFFG